MGNTIAIIYENTHRVSEEIVKGKQAAFLTASLICMHRHNMYIQSEVEKVLRYFTYIKVKYK